MWVCQKESAIEGCTTAYGTSFSSVIVRVTFSPPLQEESDFCYRTSFFLSFQLYPISFTFNIRFSSSVRLL